MAGAVEMSKIKIKNKLRQFRFENNQMTQAELADKAEVTRQTIIAIEAGQYSPSLELAIKISKAFGKKVDDVFEYEE
jgi:putative transcriptional regulator